MGEVSEHAVLPNSTLRENKRARLFFWIGMLILPVFWVWWMRRPLFPGRTIVAGQIWTVIFLLIAFMSFKLWADQFWIGLLNYKFVAIRVTLAVTVWLVVRAVGLFELVFLFIVCIDLIATLAGALAPRLEKVHLEWWVILLPAVPAVFHLLLKPDRSSAQS